MKESFSELYSRLYSENIAELEKLRKKQNRLKAILIGLVPPAILLMLISALAGASIIGLIIYAWIKIVSKNNKISPKGKIYQQAFKDKVVGPLIENTLEGAIYEPEGGMDSCDYIRAEYMENYDRYHSEDLIIVPLTINGELSTFMEVAEVHTEDEINDDEIYMTNFHGLAAKFKLSKNIHKKIYIRSNGTAISWRINKVKVDMPEFEKIFDVDSDDAVLALRILTADVMAEMIDLYEKYKYGFEINILYDTIYMRFKTGKMFEPAIFTESMEYKQIEKYYLVLKALTSLAGHMYETVDKIEI